MISWLSTTMTGRRQKAKKVITEVDLVPKQTLRGVTIQHRAVKKDSHSTSGQFAASSIPRPSKRPRHTSISNQLNSTLDYQDAAGYVDLSPPDDTVQLSGNRKKPKKSGKVSK